MPAPKGNKYSVGNNGGRPTKLTEELLKKADGYLDWCLKNPLEKWTMSGKVVPALRLPTLAGLARHLNTGRQTVYDWSKENKEFSDILDSLRAEQEKMLYEQGNIGGFNPLMAKFTLSAELDKREKTDLTTDGEKLNPSISILASPKIAEKAKELDEAIRNELYGEK